MNNVISKNDKINSTNKNKYKFFPKNKKELQKIINSQINKYGNSVDLNNIDTSKITDMS